MKRVLLTGASGFIGKQTVPYLIALGYQIYAISSQKRESSNITWIQTNLLEAGSCEEIFSRIKPTHLLHLAWETTHGMFWTSPKNLSWVKASLDLTECFIKHGGKRVVVAGTCAEYDWKRPSPLNENDPCRPLHLYGACKYGLYCILERLCTQNEVHLAWGRIFHLYGPNEPLNRFIPNLIHKLSLNQTALCSHGNQIRDFMHVEDVAHAFALLLNSTITGVINIASGEPISLKKIGEKITQIMHAEGKIEWGALSTPSQDPPVLTADTCRIDRELGMKKKYSLEQGLENTIENYLCNNR